MVIPHLHFVQQIFTCMMTSWCGNAVPMITALCMGNSPGYRWIPLTRGQLCVVLMFSLIQPVEHTAKLPMTLLWRHCIVFNPREYLSPHIANDVSMWIAHLWNIYLHIISDGELILRDETLNLKSSTQQSTAIIRVVIMGAMASQTTSLTIVYSTVYSGADHRKYQSSASLAFVRGIHRWPVNSPHK